MIRCYYLACRLLQTGNEFDHLAEKTLVEYPWASQRLRGYELLDNEQGHEEMGNTGPTWRISMGKKKNTLLDVKCGRQLVSISSFPFLPPIPVLGLRSSHSRSLD